MLPKRIFFLFLIALFACSQSKEVASSQDDGKIEIIILQINDVYEIAPLPGDDLGGLARIATLKKQLIAENPNTLMVIAGDFVSPSVIGTLDDESGDGIEGKHMIETLNAAGLDIAVFGNHEFDLKEADLQKRINESDFQWVSSNVFHHVDGKVEPFYKEQDNNTQPIPKTLSKTFYDADGTSMTLGIYSVTLDVKKAPFVRYLDPFSTAEEMTEALENENVDFILPITHMNIADDELLAEQIPKFPLIIGGHDHHHMAQKVGNTTITKADANAKTAYVHRILYDRNQNHSSVISELVKIDASILSDPVVKGVVEKWQNIANQDLLKKGFQPNAIVTALDHALDGREVTVRGGQCRLGQIVTNAIFDACENDPDIALTNSGSIRVDDVLTGKLTQYDIIRILPYSGNIWEVEMTGTLLKELLEFGSDNRNEGAYIQWKNIEHDELSKTFQFDGDLLKVDRNYTVGLNDFMLAGYDYKFFTEETEGIIKIHKPDNTDSEDVRLDIRKAIIEYLKQK